MRMHDITHRPFADVCYLDARPKVLLHPRPRHPDSQLCVQELSVIDACLVFACFCIVWIGLGFVAGVGLLMFYLQVQRLRRVVLSAPSAGQPAVRSLGGFAL